MTARSDQGPLYVGYLPLPRRHRVFIALLIPGAMLVLTALAGIIAAGQRDPGDAVWDAAEERVWTGSLIAEPYPMLIADDGTVHLVVEMGKRGAHEREQIAAAPMRAEVRGFELRRGGRRIIELTPGADAITPRESNPVLPRRGEPRAVTLRGEIIDGKCFLGAMKPGDGKAHKACAILCLEGGLPPMIAVRADPTDPTPDEIALLLVDGSADLPGDVLNLVAQPVEIRGERSMLGTLPIIDASSTDIRPVP